MAKQITPESVLLELRKHKGKANGVNVKRLVAAILLGPTTSMDERHARLAVSTLREQGHPICASPSSGYFYATTTAEIEQTCEFLYVRAMHSLNQVAQLKKKALPDIRGQLGLKL